MSRLIIGIATCGRPGVLADSLAELVSQTQTPDKVLLSPIDESKDLDLSSLPAQLTKLIQVLSGPPGLTSQRNTILKELEPDDIVLFLDDDFVMHPTYCAELLSLFNDQPEIGGHAGSVIADGVNTGGIETQEAVDILQKTELPKEKRFWSHGTTYGCNMAFRASVLIAHNIRFDEQLPLYGWFEDLDFSAQVHKYATVVNSNFCIGVHLGTKAGRSPGLRLGYSQVVNPIYLARKGTMSWRHALKNVAQRIIANTVRSFPPEPWVDRSGRLKGNIKALFELIIGKASPKRILEFK
tara:strand:+ start:7117 stop:8004 length:888 start_codon:yes stop_codon:yes gene_type:complete